MGAAPQQEAAERDRAFPSPIDANSGAAIVHMWRS